MAASASPAVHGSARPKLTDGLTDDEEDIGASEGVRESLPCRCATRAWPALEYEKEAAFRERLAVPPVGCVLVLLRHGESEWA